MLALPRLPAPCASLPDGLAAQLIDAGVGWDAVRVPEYLGDRVLAQLDGCCGGVIRDPYSHVLYFLIRPGAGDGWRFPDDAHVRLLGAGSSVYVPPVHCDRSPGPHWTRPVEAGRVLTRSRRLHVALQTVCAAEFGPGAVS